MLRAIDSVSEGHFNLPPNEHAFRLEIGDHARKILVKPACASFYYVRLNFWEGDMQIRKIAYAAFVGVAAVALGCAERSR